ncbi:Metallo-dependent phosphatase-like protein [Phakopsora pachyrhizi]|uniref:Metallo-dependent phosphatase-like protein n=1 Tax=Phakopsora pachyrhizi TaxID=170000 RepID=A0AAV0AGZ3_PHAPC|nr:Metallo-dependent phosphatase-like protein [Phakopsora pachyrhizi]
MAINPFRVRQRNPSSPQLPSKNHSHDDGDDDDEIEDAELLLPPDDKRRYKKFQSVKHSVSYISITCAAAFILIVMVWLGPGLVHHDLIGISSQIQAPVGFFNTSKSHPPDSLESDHQDTGDGNHSTLSSSNDHSSDDGNNQSGSNSSEKTKPTTVRLPHHSWNPLLDDPAPITHVFVKPCVLPPWAFKAMCAPSETAREIALYGKWVRVPRDISKGVGHFYTEIYYRRAQTLDLDQLSIPPVTGLRVWNDEDSRRDEIKEEINRDGWEPAGEDLRSGIWPAKTKSAKLWITRSKSITNHTELEPINEIDVIWGNIKINKPWWGFERIIGGPVFGSDNEMDHTRCDIIVRRGAIKVTPTPELKFNQDGNFKILQISDLHFSGRPGKCLSASLLPSCEKEGSDVSTINYLSQTIDETKPDLIVLTGDQLRGRGETFDALTTITKIGHLFADKKVPWTLVFGNHDHDKSLAIEEQMYVFKHMPYFMGQAGPGTAGFDEENNEATSANDMGVGNYVLKVGAGDKDKTQALTLYFVDSHSCPVMTLAQIFNIAMGGDMEMDWIKESQIDWYRRISESQPKVMRPYRPDFSKKKTQPVVAKKPAALMFFHIPLPEAYEEADKNPETGAEMVYGNQIEGNQAPKHDKGFYEKAILATNDGGSETEVKAIFNGHAHVTDTCRRHKGVWNCMSGVSSYSGSSKETFERRVRIVEVSKWGELIKTYGYKDGRATSVSKGNDSVKSGEVVLYDSSISSINSSSKSN